jgi:Pyruvate/2-oxoacid:ferredoxin oxidoreductase gamma subunit
MSSGTPALTTATTLHSETHGGHTCYYTQTGTGRYAMRNYVYGPDGAVGLALDALPAVAVSVAAVAVALAEKS